LAAAIVDWDAVMADLLKFFHQSLARRQSGKNFFAAD
jgi:hypothetical protein